MKTEAIEACIGQVEADLYRGCPAAERARAELAQLKACHEPTTAPSPEPAAKTELTAEELERIKWHCTDRFGNPEHISQSHPMTLTLRLLDEHAAMRSDRDDWIQVSRDWRARAESAELQVLDLKKRQCTERERAVLDAMSHLKNATLFAIQSDTETKPGLTRVMSAELARREAAKAKGDGNG